MTNASNPAINAVIIGASGYTGVELVRLSVGHPNLHIIALAADRKAGQELQDVYAHVRPLRLPPMVTVGEIDWQGVDVAFCGLPHGTSQDVIETIPDSVRVIDLSADYRLRDAQTYEQWYGRPHIAPDRLKSDAVYGLTEHAKEQLPDARLVACPGCYPTSILLPLLPLLKARLLEVESLLIDAKSGITGAGRSIKEANLFAEVQEGIHAYGVGKHRHIPEMEQEMSAVASQPVTLSFTPHLMPMNRGILSTIYAEMDEGITVTQIRSVLEGAYQDAPFIQCLSEGKMPATRHVRGSNYVEIAVEADRKAGRVIILSAIDNLVKGSSGQAIQNMNLMFGLPETTGLEQLALFP